MEVQPAIPSPLGPWHRRLRLPAYTTQEAATLCRTTRQTAARWHYEFPFAKKLRAPLSYLQLAELAFVASFRDVGVSLRKIRLAREYLSKIFRVEYPFVELRLKTDGANILKDFEELEEDTSKLIVANAAGQEVWTELVTVRFEQFDYEQDLALRWYPRGRHTPILIDPRISYGAPIVASVGVPTWVLRQRYDAGETLEEIEDDFEVPRIELIAAIDFEAA